MVIILYLEDIYIYFFLNGMAVWEECTMAACI